MIWENVSLKNHLKGHIFCMAALAKPFSLKSPTPDILHLCFSVKIKGNLSVSFSIMHLICDKKGSVPFISTARHFRIIAPSNCRFVLNPLWTGTLSSASREGQTGLERPQRFCVSDTCTHAGPVVTMLQDLLPDI